MTGTVVDASWDDSAAGAAAPNTDRIFFKIRPDSKGAQDEAWSAKETLQGLAEFEDVVTTSQSQCGAAYSDASAAAAVLQQVRLGTRPRDIIKTVNKEQLQEFLDLKARDMSKTADPTLLGFCKGGLDEGQHCKKFIETG
jgi:hypothetical protein